MTDFMAKMHQIQFRLGLRPRPRWGAYSAPDPLAVFGGLLLREGEGKGGEGEGRGGRRAFPLFLFYETTTALISTFYNNNNNNNVGPIVR